MPGSATSWTVRSGGQTGVDRAALYVAVRRGLAYVGWCPRGGKAEDYPDPPGVLAQFPRLVETPSADPRQRTAWNVRDSHATVILADAQGLRRSPGTRFTQTVAELIYPRPLMLANVDDLDAASRVAAWLDEWQRRLGEPCFVVNFAGPRESNAPGITARGERFIEAIFEELIGP
ncbi:MAG: putative molybdenum carrier protein [Gemmatales bacterium]|nr:putative molybdenum carrier protein [Gemmatales bacterium]MDW8385636.1 putative molybdenum carrier protein [Gemmatales bacterium]